ncbi:MAG: ATP-binding protein [Gemmatimonadales bacterium]
MADQHATINRLRYVPAGAAVVSIMFGVAVLESFVLVVGLPTPAPIPLDALLFMLAGVALLAFRLDFDPLRIGAAGAAALISAGVLCQYVFGVSLGLDTLLFPDTVTRLPGAYPGRPSPISALVFLLIALLLFPYHKIGPRLRIARVVAVLGVVILPTIPLTGHILGVPELYALGQGPGMELYTILVLELLAIGIALTFYETGALELLLEKDPGSILLRWLLPVAVLLPLLFTAGSIHALRLGIYQIHIVLSLYAALFIGLSVGAAFWVATVVRQADNERRASDRATADLSLTERLLHAEAAAGAAIRESQRRISEVLDLLGHAPLFARGLDGQIRFWSSGAERLYGWTARAAIGRISYELLETECEIPLRDAEAQLLEKGEWHGSVTRTASDGSRVVVTSYWILHRADSGVPDAVIEVDRDVTGQRQAEQMLKGSEARYRALVAASAQIVWTATADGRRGIEMHQWEAFTGQRAGNARRHWLEAIHPDDRVQAAEAWRDAVRDKKVLATQHRLRRKDGEYRQMEVRAVPVLDDHGRIREWISAYTDITDRVRAEEELGQARKLQAVGTLAGGVAHEVNNQLMAVIGFGDFVLGALGPDHPQSSDVQVMIRSATRASQVAQQLLTFSRRQVKQTKPLDMYGAVLALVPVLERLLGADKRLVVQPNRASHHVVADPTQIDQVLINLAANARDAMGTGGRLQVAVDEVLLDESYGRTHGVSHFVPGIYVRLTVSDTGCGMDRTTLAKIFEPFFTTKPVGVGTGLGLSTVYGIVKQHDGFVWAESEPGSGTTMRVYLPAAQADAEGVAEGGGETVMIEPMEQAVVLVVEDEASVRSMVRRSLEAVGLTVVEAKNGREALEMVATRPERPRLVLTDVIMPELNGRELSEALASSQPGLPVLFMSGYTGEDVLARSLLPETAQFIQKPFAPEELVARVRTLLSVGIGPPTSPRA